MSRPTGPPPYTLDEIALLETPEERFQASAELRSYIVGHQMADLRDQGLLGAPSYTLTNINSNGASATPRPQFTPAFSTATPGSNGDNHSPPIINAVGPQRTRRGDRGDRPHAPYPTTGHLRSNHGARLAARNGASSVKAHDSGLQKGTSKPSAAQRNNQVIRSNELCANFTSTGKCTRFRCPDVHDIKKLALCKQFLYKNVCTEDTYCSLSHDATPNNTPHCQYFLKGRCKNSPCMYAHVQINRNAPVCESFGKLGYCAQGEVCSNLHVYECPDFANKGSCDAGDSCPLRHVYYASRMKAATLGSSGVGSPESVVDDEGEYIGDMSSPENIQDHAITQQHDYVAFDDE